MANCYQFFWGHASTPSPAARERVGVRADQLAHLSDATLDRLCITRKLITSRTLRSNATALTLALSRTAGEGTFRSA
jgi:hypothetical protein